MKKIILVFLIAVMLSGCIGSESIAGTYYHTEVIDHGNGWKESINESIQIYPDNTFLYSDLVKDYSYSGIVQKHGDKYVFSSSMLSFSGTFNNGNLTTDGTSLFIKQR
jgi:hypothetical protein